MSSNDIFLINYRHPNCEPLKSITQLPEKEAFVLAKKLYLESPCRANNRFGSGFAEYYKHRIEMEQWLYDKFTALGGNPQIKNPFYFTLQHSQSLYENFDKGEIIKIKLQDIDDTDISFTFNDSMAKFYSSDWEEPFLKSRLYDLISANENSFDKFLCTIQPRYHYIEAQLWTDKYFNLKNKQGRL